MIRQRTANGREEPFNGEHKRERAMMHDGEKLKENFDEWMEENGKTPLFEFFETTRA